jgi:LAO/AO transport system kinase
MATRGTLGGLARATSDAVDVLDAAGFTTVLVETVGVGQDEVDIARAADTTVVVLVPGLGDDIQAIKAGILEIGDLFLVNKADRDGSDKTVAELTMMLDLSHPSAWRAPILRTVAPRAEGIVEAVEALDRHAEHLSESGEGSTRRRQRARTRLLDLLDERFRRTVEARAPEAEGLEEAVGKILERREDPYSASRRLFERLLREPVGQAR